MIQTLTSGSMLNFYTNGTILTMKSDDCKLATNKYGQRECRGCSRIATLLRQKKNREQTDPSFNESLVCRIHSSYEELDGCAKFCIGCQVIRRAFLLNQITVREAESLRKLQGQIRARLPSRQEQDAARSREEMILVVSIGNSAPHPRTAKISCVQGDYMSSLALAKDPLSQTVFSQIEEWLSNCRKNHEQCANLTWNNHNPSNLIQILGDSDELRLVDSRQSPVLFDYVALSYCWGDQDSIRKVESGPGWEEIQNNQTTKSNLNKRRQSFPRSDLSQTIQDALHLIQRLGLEYIWVDAVCVPVFTNWNDEANRMHEVYGNAAFTLSACSSETSNDEMFQTREAWRYNSIPCKLSDRWLTNFDMSLNEVRLRARLFSRGWVLQEERLSPRILYWCGQRVYWSCFCSQRTELRSPMRETGIPYQPHEDRKEFEWLQPPQEFLNLRRIGDRDRLHQQWLDLVEAYTRRNMYRSEDRFPAFSGLAVQYLRGRSSYKSREGIVTREDYLAGLWRGSFGSDLAWLVIQAQDPSVNLRKVAPTWSWASLPFRTSTRMERNFKDASTFDVLDVQLRELNEEEMDERVDMKEKEEANAKNILDIVKEGARVKAVKVRGHMRRFVGHDSQIVPWASILRGDGTEERYSFRMCIDQNIHSRNMANGKVLAYEAHKQEVVGQLDYVNTQEKEESCCVPVGAEKDLYCLQIGYSTMLLVEKTEEDHIFRRSGISSGHRPNFFDEATVEEVWLV